MQGDSPASGPFTVGPSRGRRGTAEERSDDAGGFLVEDSCLGGFPFACSQAREPPWLTSFARPPKSLDASHVSPTV